MEFYVGELVVLGGLWLSREGCRRRSSDFELHREPVAYSGDSHESALGGYQDRGCFRFGKSLFGLFFWIGVGGRGYRGSLSRFGLLELVEIFYLKGGRGSPLLASCSAWNESG